MRKSKIFLGVLFFLSCTTRAAWEQGIELMPVVRRVGYNAGATESLSHAFSRGAWNPLLIKNLVEKHHADPNTPGVDGDNGLVRACKEDDCEVVQCLVDNKADPNPPNSDRWQDLDRDTPLFECKSPEVLRALVEAKADLSAKYFKDHELNVLEYYLQYGRLPVVAELCDMVDVSAETRLKGDSPLHILFSGNSFSYRGQRAAATALLLLAGVDPQKRNAEGQLYSDSVFFTGNPEMIAQINRFAGAVGRIQEYQLQRQQQEGQQSPGQQLRQRMLKDHIAQFIPPRDLVPIVVDYYGQRPSFSVAQAKYWWDEVQSGRL